MGKGELVAREPDLEQRRAGPALDARPAGRLEPLERLLLAREHPRHATQVGDHLVATELRREYRQLAFQLDEVGPCIEDGLEWRALVTGRVLVEIHDSRTPAVGDIAAVGGFEPGEDLQQRRLAAPVRPDDADASPRRTVRSAPSRMRRDPNDFVIAWPASSVTAWSGRVTSARIGPARGTRRAMPGIYPRGWRPEWGLLQR